MTLVWAKLMEVLSWLGGKPSPQEAEEKRLEAIEDDDALLSDSESAFWMHPSDAHDEGDYEPPAELDLDGERAKAAEAALYEEA
jgi:hypothetical protein